MHHHGSRRYWACSGDVGTTFTRDGLRHRSESGVNAGQSYNESNHMQARTMNRRRFDPNHLAARDVLIIIPVVLGIVALFIAFAGLVSHDAYVKFGGLAIDTAALFGFFLHDSREYLRKIWFWLLT